MLALKNYSILYLYIHVGACVMACKARASKLQYHVKTVHIWLLANRLLVHVLSKSFSLATQVLTWLWHSPGCKNRRPALACLWPLHPESQWTCLQTRPSLSTYTYPTASPNNIVNWLKLIWKTTALPFNKKLFLCAKNNYFFVYK